MRRGLSRRLGIDAIVVEQSDSEHHRHGLMSSLNSQRIQLIQGGYAGGNLAHEFRQDKRGPRQGSYASLRSYLPTIDIVKEPWIIGRRPALPPAGGGEGAGPNSAAITIA